MNSIIFTTVGFVVQDVSSLKEETSTVRTTTTYLKITAVLFETMQCTDEAEIESKDI